MIAFCENHDSCYLDGLLRRFMVKSHPCSGPDVGRNCTCANDAGNCSAKDTNTVLKNKYAILVVITSVVLLLDQLSKIWIRVNIPLRSRPVEVIPNLFRLVHVENKGAAWGILAESAYRIPFFVIATLVAFVVIGIYFYKIPKNQNLVAAAMSLILGGAIGNFIDRVLYQSVTDFLDFYISYQPISGWLIRTFRSNRWPSFNIADTAIVFGLLLIMLDMFVLEGRRARAEAEGTHADKAQSKKEEGAA